MQVVVLVGAGLYAAWQPVPGSRAALAAVARRCAASLCGGCGMGLPLIVNGQRALLLVVHLLDSEMI